MGKKAILPRDRPSPSWSWGGRIAASNNTAIFRVAMHCSIVDAFHSETLFPKRGGLRLIAAQISLSFKHPGANNRRPRFRDSRNRQLNPPPSPGYCGGGSRTINCILVRKRYRYCELSLSLPWINSRLFWRLNEREIYFLDRGFFSLLNFVLFFSFLCNFYFKTIQKRDYVFHQARVSFRKYFHYDETRDGKCVKSNNSRLIHFTVRGNNWN